MTELEEDERINRELQLALDNEETKAVGNWTLPNDARLFDEDGYQETLERDCADWVPALWSAIEDLNCQPSAK